MKKIIKFIKQHKILSIIYFFLIFSLINNLVNERSIAGDIFDAIAVTIIFIYINNSKTFTKKIIVCPSCGNNIEYGQNNCPNCGSSIVEQKDSISIKRKYRKGNILTILGISIMLIPFGICTTLYGIASLFYAMFGGSFDNWNTNVFSLPFKQPFLIMTIICLIAGTIMLVIGIITKNKEK